jgi:hypothetical protein
MRPQLIAAIAGILLGAACSPPSTPANADAMAQAKMPGVETTRAMSAEHAPPGQKTKAGAMTQEDLITLALSAGPADITAHAAVVDMDEAMRIKEIRPGTNGWACMAHPEVMCVDKEWQTFLDAYANKRDPRVKTVGIGYMLRGDQGASNTDPYATKPTADNHWVVSPPHIMILTPDTKQLEALPSDFRTGGPWVMWKGTRYAHIMVPTTAMASDSGTSH